VFGFVILFVLLATALLLGTKAALRLIQTILGYVLSRATKPTTSPFTYFGSLIGLIIVATKLLMEVVKAF
jgi:hypothetical protein